MLGFSRAFSIPCPLQLLHLVFSSLVAWRNKFVNQIALGHRCKIFACSVIFVLCGWGRFDPLSCGFKRFHHTAKKSFRNLLGCNFLRSLFRVASPSFPFAQHGCCHGSFPFSPPSFESFFVVLVIRINKVNSSLSSSTVVFWLLVFPFLFFFFSILSGFANFGPYFWPYVIWSGRRLNFCQSLPVPHMSPFGRFFLSLLRI